MKEKKKTPMKYLHPDKPIGYVDMDGVLANYEKRAEELGIIVEAEKSGIEVPLGFFENLEPIEGAIKALHTLSEYYELYILSTAPWSNPDSWKEKRIWIEKHFGDLVFKRLILSHNKALLKGSFLIDDYIHEGFEGEHIQFGEKKFPDWETVLNYLTPTVKIY